MVIGLLGPSIPAIVQDLGITYSQAGLFFTMLAMGSLFGTSLGAIASDYINRKLLFFYFALALVIGLICVGFIQMYGLLLLLIFGFSLLGSPIGAVGQSIMLDMYPEKRGKYLSIQTVFAAAGGFIAPLLVSLNFILHLGWRWSFVQTGMLAFVLCLAVLFVRIPAASRDTSRLPLKEIFRNRRVIFCALIIFFNIAVDIGFSYWLAEYFKTELGVNIRLSSAVVGIYLAGVITGRSLVPVLLKRLHTFRIIQFSLIIALASLLLFLFIPFNGIKAVLCYTYGLGIAPLFPLMLAEGAGTYPKQPGAVTGFLFGWMSLGGMVFPLLLGKLAESVGIERSYLFNVVVCLGILISISLWYRKEREGFSVEKA